MRTINSDTIFYNFQSLEDFYSFRGPNEKRWLDGDSVKIINQRGIEWSGAKDENEILSRKFQWFEGVERLSHIPKPEIDIPKAKTEYIWNDTDGDRFNFDRYLNNMPYLQKRKKVIGHSQCGSMKKIRINIGESCKVTSEEMLWKVYAAGVIADCYESSGFRTEIWIEIKSHGCYERNQRNIEAKILLKRTQDPLNIQLLLTCCSPWMFRYWIFRLLESDENKDISYTLGTPQQLIKIDENDVIINCKSCLSRTDAIEIIKSIK